MEDRPPRKGEFIIRLFCRRIVCIIRYGTFYESSSNRYLVLSHGQQDHALKTFRCEIHGTQYQCLRQPVSLHKLPIQTLFQGKTVHRYTRSQDCVGATNTVFFFPPYLRAQIKTSLHPVASVLAARKMSHILGQTPPTLELVYRRLASNSRPIFV